MLGNQIRKLLLEERLPTGTAPFASGKELASQVGVKLVELGTPRSTKSLTTLMSAIFLNRRPCADDLKKGIMAAATHRFKERGFENHPNLLAIRTALESYNASLEKEKERNERVPEEVQQIISFFNARARKGTLLVVEYRDLPRTYPTAKYAGLLRPAAEAIVKGMSLAMFQPFQSQEKARFAFRHSEEVTNYLRDIFLRVRFTCVTFKKVVRDIAKESGVDPDEAEKRVMLYERNSNCGSGIAFLSGIQSRMFYTYYPSGDFPYAPILEEAWEWVAGSERDYFIQRESSIERVLAQQFFPVVKYWHAEQRLPIEPEELSSAVVKFNKELGAEIPKDAWVIYDPSKGGSR